MTRLLLSAVCLVCLGGQDLGTDYTKKRSLRIESETSIEMETKSSAMVVDGEERDFGGRGGQSSTTTRRVVQIDSYLEHEDGSPKVVRRMFDSLAGSTEMDMGGQTREIASDTPLDGVTLELRRAGPDVKVEVIAGDAPADDALLEGHRLDLALDALLPQDEVEEGASYEVDPAAVGRALGLDLEAVLFQRAPREGGGERGGRGGAQVRRRRRRIADPGRGRMGVGADRHVPRGRARGSHRGGHRDRALGLRRHARAHRRPRRSGPHGRRG